MLDLPPQKNCLRRLQRGDRIYGRRLREEKVMKFFTLLCLLLSVSVFARGQSATDKVTSVAAPVNVLEVNWKKEVFIPALYDNPLRVNQDRDDLERDRKATADANSARAKQGQTPLPTPTKKIASNTPVGSTPMGTPIGDQPAGNQNLPAQPEPGTSSVYYVYKAKVRNIGEKDIRVIRWQYILTDQTTGEVVGSHSFTTPVNLRAGKALELIGKSRTIPARVVDAKNAERDLHGKYVERVVIDAIQYADGNTWYTAP